MNRLRVSALVALIALALARIATGQGEVSQTIDEAVHVAAGVEWLEEHSYRLHPENPPLARIAVALLPYWAGARSVVDYDDANLALGSGSDYPTRLRLARAGTLPTLVLLIVVVYMWSRSVFDPLTALAASFLLSTLPALLAHSGLATTDVAAAAGTLCAVLAFSHWLAAPGYRRAALLGLAVGLAALIKFTSLLFLVASALAILAARAVLAAHREASPETHAQSEGAFRHSVGPLASQLAVCLVAIVATIWSGYLWSVGPVDLGQSAPYDALDAALPATSFARGATIWLLGAHLPAPEFVLGLIQLGLHGLEGHSAYLLGQVSPNGWWYFFPVAIAVKTPLPFLALALAGTLLCVQRARQQRQWLYLVPALAPLAILVSVMPSSLNIGLRHVLAVFPFLSVCGGVALTRLWTSEARPLLARTIAVALILWQLAASLGAHPNYIGYFNAIASERPEDFLIDSDLDWGQDLYHLRDALEERDIDDAWLAVFTTADLGNLGLERFRMLGPGEQRRGWVAASLFTLRRQPGYAWLEAYEPEALIGSSIRLYRIDSLREGKRPAQR